MGAPGEALGGPRSGCPVLKALEVQPGKPGAWRLAGALAASLLLLLVAVPALAVASSSQPDALGRGGPKALRGD